MSTVLPSMSEKVVQPRMLMAENMADMELKEIVRESYSLMNKCKRQFLPFFLCIYIPVALMYTFIVRLHHDRADNAFQAFITVWKQQQQHQFADPTSPPPINPVVSNTQLLLETILLVAFMIGYYHMITSTILTLSALHQSAKNRADRSPEDQGQSGEPFSAKKIAAMLPSRTWRVFVTHVVCIVAYMGIILLMLLATLVLVGLAKTVLDLEVAYISLLLELYMFTVRMIYFVLTISLVEQVSTVEHVWGWVAIKRSATLLRGKKMTAISVLIFHTVCVYGIYILQVAIFNHIAYRERLTGGHSLQARSVLRCGNKFGLGWCVYVAYILQLTLRIGAPWTLPIAIALNVGLASLMFWFVISTTTILYFSCKATHNERGLALPMLISGKTGPRVDYEPLFCIATNECGNKLSQGAFGKFPHGKRDGFPTMNVPTLT